MLFRRNIELNDSIDHIQKIHNQHHENILKNTHANLQKIQTTASTPKYKKPLTIIKISQIKSCVRERGLTNAPRPVNVYARPNLKTCPAGFWPSRDTCCGQAASRGKWFILAGRGGARRGAQAEGAVPSQARTREAIRMGEASRCRCTPAQRGPLDTCVGRCVARVGFFRLFPENVRCLATASRSRPTGFRSFWMIYLYRARLFRLIIDVVSWFVVCVFDWTEKYKIFIVPKINWRYKN